ncbi:MAG: hypothetical protein QG597_2447 [Actinomycetota bacterium]|nr:hypothetical protein [Actinomycetota bacterium]
MRLPTTKDLLRFLAVEGWEDKDAASGKRTGDHHRFVFTTPTGDRLYTKVSHGTKSYRSRDLFKAILRDQLQVSEEEFWQAVDHGVAPNRPRPEQPAQTKGGGIDAKLARNLLTKVGVRPTELAGLSQGDAVALWQAWLADHPEG